MECPRCKNEDPKYFYYGSKGWYCRKCISFRRVLLDQPQQMDFLPLDVVDESYELPFSLTQPQKDISRQLLQCLQRKESVLISAVCGAGKTELVYAAIAYYLRQKKRVAFAISRRQVVLQLQERLQRDFKHLKVIAVCEGYTKELNGDLIVCTTHQLYRYYQWFDLLIIDEPDAFPYHNNEVLQAIAKSSCKGEIVYLSATPDEDLLKQVKQKELVQLQLSIRPSLRPLAMPICYRMPKSWSRIFLFFWLEKRKKQQRKCFVFFPTIRLVEIWYRVLSKWYLVGMITSKTKDKDEVMKQFAKGEIQILLCTTILERGITFEGIDVLVMDAQHIVYSSSSLIQIMGRVARGTKDPSGEGVFLSQRKTERIQQCIEYIRLNNEAAFGVTKTYDTNRI